MKNVDVDKHVKGQSIFIDDMPEVTGTLHAFVFDSSCAHGKITALDFEQAKAQPGVHCIITASDIPGENQVGGIIQDESLLASDKVHFIGEPIALVLADNMLNAKKAAKHIHIEYEKLDVITNPRAAFNANKLIMPPKVFENGNVDDSWQSCDFVFEGKAESGGQEHLYLETQAAYAMPKENDKILIYSSTQSPTSVQKITARVLNLPMNNIEIDVMRLGGGFGGKEDQATHWAVLAALGALLTNRPVKLVLPRHQDLRVTGKRHPYSSDYKVGLNKQGKILAYEATYYQNAGACADLSPAILERTLFHATNSYYVPNVRATGISCKTNLHPHTAFRGFGGPQAMFVMECAISHASKEMGIEVDEIQKNNLIKDGDDFYYGQKAEAAHAVNSWTKGEELFNFSKLKNDVLKFNTKKKLVKKGFALMPVCFGISFTSSFLNQASALVHIYTDGSVGISTAAVEMGQGVNAKIIGIVAKTFSINPDRVRIETTNTTRIVNTSATAASSGADLNGNAALLACKNILNRLQESAAEELNVADDKSLKIVNEAVLVNGKETDLKWEQLILKTYMKRINLSSHAYYSTPEIYFDRTINKGRPFAYHVYGTAAITVKLDCVLGRYEIEDIYVVHDYGKTLHEKVDIGQVEGGMLQGIGWMTMEELDYSNEGHLLSNSLSTYKIPDIHFAPNNFNIHFLEDSENRFGPLKSKAIGEPPLMYGIGAYFAIKDAMKAFRPNLDIKFSAPLTPEKVLLALYPD
jgi:xanthine dehydrogenase large subunit